jgi:hypothetical protein
VSDLFTYANAKAERDAAMASVAKNADEACHRWSVLAFQWIQTYALAHREFISEECTEAAEKAGIPKPHDLKAWGPAFQRASKQKIIVRIGYGVSKRRHLSPTPLWQSQTYRGK